MPLWELLLSLDDKQVVDLLDLSYCEDVLTRAEALELLAAARPGREQPAPSDLLNVATSPTVYLEPSLTTIVVTAAFATGLDGSAKSGTSTFLAASSQYGISSRPTRSSLRMNAFSTVCNRSMPLAG